MKYIKQRSREISTLSGIGMIASAIGSVFGYQLELDHVTAISTAVGGVIGLVEVFRREKQ